MPGKRTLILLKRRRRKSGKSGKDIENILNKSELSLTECKRLPMSRIMRYNQYRPYTFTRLSRGDYSILANKSTTYNSNGIIFRLADVESFDDFSARFDQYRLLKVRLEFRPLLQNVNQLQGSTIDEQFTIPQIYVYTDYDDSNAPDESTVRSRQTVLVRQATKPFSYEVVPQALGSNYATLTTTGYSVDNRAKWIDTSNPGVTHYGVKWYIEGCNPTTPGSGPLFGYKVTLRYLFQVRGLS